jgi:hypothetical protein
MTPSAPAARRAGAAAALLCTVALAAGCASTSNGSASGQAASATPAKSASSAPAAAATASASAPASVAACATTDLSGTVVLGQGGAAAGSTYYPLNLTNNSKSSCSLFGYPGVSFVTGPSGGSQIGQPATRNPAITPSTVVLSPGQTAHVTIQVVDALNYSKTACQPVKAHWLKIFPPGQFSALYVKFTALTCSAKLPGNLGSPLTVDAVKDGAGKPGGGL